MIIYKDFISEDELFTDIYPMTETHDGFFYRLEGKLVTESTQISDAMFGGNASAEGGGDEGADDAISNSGINVALAHELVSTSFKKGDYKAYIKDFMKQALAKMTKDGNPAEEIKAWQKKAQKVVVEFILPNFDDFEFYIGKSLNDKGMVVLVNWEPPKKDPKADEIPVLYIIKDCLIPEKC